MYFHDLTHLQMREKTLHFFTILRSSFGFTDYKVQCFSGELVKSAELFNKSMLNERLRIVAVAGHTCAGDSYSY